MEFHLDLNSIFKSNMIKVNQQLLPIGFHGDRRQILETTRNLTEIINSMGEASARAQGLSKPVTTAQKLRNSDHIVYLLADESKKSVSGLLKIGTKNLYVFDLNGETQQVQAPCVLDFYIHESKQRSGYGKQLFEFMLEQEKYQPSKMAIDRPSDKLLGFLRKYYDLERTVPQMNNFVVYEGFFNNNKINREADHRVHITSSPNTVLFGPHYVTDKIKTNRPQQPNILPLPVTHTSTLGRFGAPRPICSMAEIIHSSPTPVAGEPNSSIIFDTHKRFYHHVHNDYDDNHDDNDQKLVITNDKSESCDVGVNNNVDNADNYEEKELIETFDSYTIPNQCMHNENYELTTKQTMIQSVEDATAGLNIGDNHNYQHHNHNNHLITTTKPQNHFLLSKQHTGLKNRSFNVGAAVSPTDKMEFIQEIPESFGIVKINQPIGGIKIKPMTINDSKNHPIDNNGQLSSNQHISPTTTTVADGGEGMTDQGYFDLKFYHNKLW